MNNQCRTRTYFVALSRYGRPNIAPILFKTWFAKRPYTRLGTFSALSANLGNLNSKYFSGRVPSHVDGNSISFKYTAGGHPLSTYAKFSEKLTFLEMLVFRKILRTYLMDGPQMYAQKTLSYAWKNSS